MLTVTQEFKDALRAPVKRTSGYIVLQDGTELLPGDVLQSYTIESVGGFLRTAMSKITVSLLGEHSLVGSAADVYYGVFYGEEFHYVLRGKFNITEAVHQKDTDVTTLTGYDNMTQFQIDYTTVGEFPTTLFEYLRSIAALAGVVLENTDLYNGTLTIDEDPYVNINEYTIRDILEDICEASASYALINSKGNLELRQVADTGEVLTYADMLDYEIGEYWGEINSLVLSRQPQNDDVFLRDDTDINSPTTKNLLDLTKFRISYSEEDE